MPTESHVAIRAICKHINDGGWTSTSGGRQSSVFMTSRDANASLRGFYESVLVPNWEDIRIKILTAPGGYLKLPGQSLRGRTLAFERSGPAKPLSALPTHLNGRYGLSGCTGTNPLYPGDPRLATGTPMSSSVEPAAFLVAIKHDPGAPGGWYVDSAYPQ